MLITDALTLELDQPLTPEGWARIGAAIERWLVMEREEQRRGACAHAACMAYRLECFRRAQLVT